MRFILLPLVFLLPACSTIRMNDISDGLARYSEDLEYQQKVRDKQQALYQAAYFQQLEKQANTKKR